MLQAMALVGQLALTIVERVPAITEVETDVAMVAPVAEEMPATTPAVPMGWVGKRLRELEEKLTRGATGPVETVVMAFQVRRTKRIHRNRRGCVRRSDPEAAAWRRGKSVFRSGERPQRCVIGMNTPPAAGNAMTLREKCQAT